MAAKLFATMIAIRDGGLTICLVEQDVRATLEVADYGYVLANGKVIDHGPAGDLLEAPSIRTSYLGL